MRIRTGSLLVAVMIFAFEAGAQLEQAQPVHILPMDGEFLDSIVVTLSTVTEDAVITYSLIRPDSNHTENIRYTAPFVIRETLAVDARATKQGMSRSATRTRYYKKSVSGLKKVRPVKNGVSIGPEFNALYFSVLGKSVQANEISPSPNLIRKASE